MRKRILAVFLVWLFVLSLSACGEEQPSVDSQNDAGSSSVSTETSVPSAEQSSPVTDFEWEETDDGIVITKYNGSDKHIMIPSMIENKKVIDIGAAFADNDTIESVILSEHMTVLRKEMFEGCDALKVLKAPAVTILGEGAWRDAEELDIENLEELYLPKVQRVTLLSLYGLKNLKKLDILSAVQIDSYHTFYDPAWKFESLEEVWVSEDLHSTLAWSANYTTYTKEELIAEDLPVSEEKSVDYPYIFGQDSITVNGVLYTK